MAKRSRRTRLRAHFQNSQSLNALVSKLLSGGVQEAETTSKASLDTVMNIDGKLTAGQEWDYKIRVRITKEFTGNEWEDDKQWEEWKKAVAAPEQDIGCDPASLAGSELPFKLLKV